MDKMGESYDLVDSCRVCGNENLETYFDFGDMPLCNGLEDPRETKPLERFPLAVNYCPDCSLSQLTVSVKPEILFRDYPYRSSISASFGDHCDELSGELNESILRGSDMVVDLASNDGYLLQYFKNRGNRVLGIDPARNLARIANERGIETLDEFWNADLSEQIEEEYGKAKVITAFNVFAHVPDIRSFTKGVSNLLDEGGYFIIESPHVQNLIENSEFDTIYHEHVSYLSAKAVNTLMNANGLRVAKIRKFPIHGGSIRFYVEQAQGPNTSDGSLEETLLEEEQKGVHNIESYRDLHDKASKIRGDLLGQLHKLKQEGKRVSAFGASAKGNTLLNFCGIDNSLISHIFDDTPEKQGFISPGTKIPIVSRDQMDSINPDYLVLLPWNFSEELMRKTRAFANSGGKYIIPVPQVKVI